ncbi:TAXI family TRAP transporter solute-binding subunit [Alkalilacustris brevis]|uniref:TAXI family TRAP transporter solute-binding subunit n=1 Tax=Alkalilacustris brevis TaxID=2026338 RepID=UPI000E0D73B4|nr:TAXI family TRAP transporter solute-binding subunit [Alkalilacustris brevis]
MKHAIATVVLSLGVAAGGSAAAQTVGVATSNPGSLMHGIGTAVATAASQSGLNASVQAATSPSQYLPFVAGNNIEFGVSNLEEFIYALEGREWFGGQANENLRVVALIMPLQLGTFVRADSGIRTISDLEGRSLVGGFGAQPTVLPQLAGILATAGLTRDDVVTVQVPSVVAGADAFMAGDVDAFHFAHGGGKVREADAAVGGVYALPVENSPEALEALREHWQTGQILEISPGPAAPGVTETASYVAFPQLVFTNADVDDAMAYQMAKAIYENQQLLGETFPPFLQFDPQEHMVGEVAPAEYHPGAIAFYREVGLWND